MVCCGPPTTRTWTVGFARRLRYQAGCWSSPPREATTTYAGPSRSGAVSITLRGCPLLRPVVVSSSAGIPPKLAPTRPPVTRSAVRCTAFMVFRTRSLGTRVSGSARGELGRGADDVEVVRRCCGHDPADVELPGGRQVAGH